MYIIRSDAGQPLREELAKSPDKILANAFPEFLPKSEASAACKLLWPLYVYQQKHPLNLILLGIWTSCLSITVGVSCANTDGKIVLEALILTSAVVASLTAYTFWASKKGKNFSFLGPILFTSLFVLLLTSFLQMFFPLRSTSTAIYGGISVVVFSGYIVYNI